MLNQVFARRILAVLFLGALLIAPPARAEEADQPSAQATPAQSPTPAVAAPALSPEDAALRAIQDEGQRQVAAIVQQLAALSQGPELLELQKRVEQIKQDTTVQFLAARARFARERGDEAAAITAEAVINQILHPAPPPTAAGPQLPDKSASAKGGK